MAITKMFGVSEEEEIHNNLIRFLNDIGVISNSARLCALKGPKIQIPGAYATVTNIDTSGNMINVDMTVAEITEIPFEITIERDVDDK